MYINLKICEAKMKGRNNQSHNCSWRFSYTPLSVIDRISRQKKIRKDIESLNHPVNHINLTHIYETLHQTAAKYLFFSNALRIFTKIELILNHKEKSQ